MLTPADAEVVARDPELPALAVLLDPQALQAWLAEQTGTACTVRPLRLRYKQATSCVLGFDLVSITGSTLCVAKAYSEDAAAKMTKSVQRAHAGAVVAFDPSARLLVTAITADRDLPVLAALHDEQARDKVLRRLLPEHRRHVPAAVRTLRYNPERRWVGVVDTGRQTALLRSYRGREVGRSARAYASLERHGPPTPRLLGVSRHHGTSAVEWIPGRQLTPSGGAADTFAAAGTALAKLHQSPVGALDPLDAVTQGRAARSAGQQISVLLPELAIEAARFAELVAAKIQRIGPVRTALHGDFSADQVVVGAGGRVTLIDLDAAGIGDPAIDLGCAAAALVADAEADSGPLIQAMRAGYAAVRPLPSPERLAVHGAAYLLRRAGEAFRRRDADWADQARHLLYRAEGELASLRTQGVRW